MNSSVKRSETEKELGSKMSFGAYLYFLLTENKEKKNK